MDLKDDLRMWDAASAADLAALSRELQILDVLSAKTMRKYKF